MLATTRPNLQQRMISTLERHPDMDRFSRLPGIAVATVLAIGAVSSLTARGRAGGRIAKAGPPALLFGDISCTSDLIHTSIAHSAFAVVAPR